MSSVVRAHFDGKQVVLDEPAPFEPGEKLIVSRPANEGGISTARLEPTFSLAGEGTHRTLREVFESRPDPEDESNDLYDAVMELRTVRRQWAAEKADEEPWL